MAIDPAEQENLIDRLLELFQSNDAAIEYGNDPQGWVDDNLPEGVEPGDVAGCMPDVAGRLGGPYQGNAAQYNAYHGSAGSAATQSVINEISYTYNTIYQQNAFIYAEEGAQVSNIQGDGNTVTQVQIDDSFDVDHPEDYYEDEGGYEEEGEYDGEPEDGGYEPEPEPEDEGGYEEEGEYDGEPEDGGYEPEPEPEDGGYEPEPEPEDGGEPPPEPDEPDLPE